MLIKDEALQQKHFGLTPQEAEAEKRRAWAKETWEHAKVLVDPATSPANWERQAGKRLSITELENRLQKLNPNLHFEVIPQNPTHKRMNILYGGVKEKICVYNNKDYIPEFSIFDWKEEELVDTELRNVDRKDLPEMQWKGAEVNSETGEVRGEGFQFKGDIPGVTKVKRPWHELVRGWRTMLAYLVHHGLTSPELVEREFGSCERISWATQMGRASHNLPF